MSPGLAEFLSELVGKRPRLAAVILGVVLVLAVLVILSWI